MARLLIVDDEEAILSAMRRGFEYEGYTVLTASDGHAALRVARRSRPDLVVLDLMLPRMSGMRVCERLRAEGDAVPIIMLTARDQEADKVVGLRAGADDYVTKPFSFLELLARVEAVLRRVGTVEADEPVLRFDARRMEVSKNGRPLGLSRREYRILEFFANHAGEIVTRDQLLDAVWGYNAFPFTRTVDTHVAKLRKRVEDDPSNPKLIVTVHGVGYRYTG